MNFWQHVIVLNKLSIFVTPLRYMGAPICRKSYLFGDNKSVVDSSMQVHAKLHKRHTMLSFHRVGEAVTSGMI
jgi:hypothetical protein